MCPGDERWLVFACRLSLREAEVAARPLRLRLQILEARAPSDFAGAFSAASRERAGALLVVLDVMFFAERTRLAELAAKHRLPLTGGLREYAEAGGLLTYGPNLRDSFRRAATYVDRILKGASLRVLP